MLGLSMLFLVIAIVSALLGFTGMIAGAMVGIAKFLFFIFIVLWLVTMFMGRGRKRGAI